MTKINSLSTSTTYQHMPIPQTDEAEATNMWKKIKEIPIHIKTGLGHLLDAGTHSVNWVSEKAEEVSETPLCQKIKKDIPDFLLSTTVSTVFTTTFTYLLALASPVTGIVYGITSAVVLYISSTALENIENHMDPDRENNTFSKIAYIVSAAASFILTTVVVKKVLDDQLSYPAGMLLGSVVIISQFAIWFFRKEED